MRLISSGLCLATLLLSGCESMPEQIAPVLPPQVQVVEGSREQVLAAVRQAFRRLDYQVTRSSGSQLEAASAIRTSETFGDSRQMVVKLNLRDAEPGKFEVEMWVTEEVVSKSMGGSRRHALKENGFFGLYFATLQQVLHENGSGSGADKN